MAFLGACSSNLPAAPSTPMASSMSILGRGRCGNVLRTVLRGQEVALKVVDLWKAPSLHDVLKHEIDVYQQLHHLQGVYIPRLVWSGFLGSKLYGLATTIVGSQLRPTPITRRTVFTALRSLHAIHRKGYAHGDLRKENLVRGSMGKVYIIDFETCHKGTKREMKRETRDLLGVLSFCSL
jgi:predicted Ser/Thr protein kinase